MKILQILVLCGLLLGNITVTDGQVCNSSSYTLIENPRRSTMAVYDYQVDISLCDDVLSEAPWYRFLSYAGETVVERAANDSVPINRCGTVTPIYIRGLNSHPSVDSTTLDATVCANFGGNPCNWMETIKIHRCPAQGPQSVYFLYNLKPPPGCPLAYCVGEKPPCNQREYWNGFSCVNYFPPMTGFPLFGGPYTTGSGFTMEVYFTCRVQYARRPNDTNARFRVTFLFDGRTMERVNVMNRSTGRFEDLRSFYLTAANSSTSIIVLGENYLRGRLGREISCKADSYWDGYEPGSALSNSTMLSQTKFYAALESEYSSYVLNPSEGSTYTIVFRSTLPLTCRHCSDMTCCYYDFRMRSEAATSTCSVRWRSGYTATAHVYILPGLSQSQLSYGMTFEPYRDDFISGSSSLWRDYLIPPVTVEAVPSLTSTLMCYSVTDPYIKTFDNAYFWNLQVGDFYLVRTSQSMESDACAINGQCYVNTARKTNNRCLQCLPERSLSSWTDTTVAQEWKPCTRQCDYGSRSRDKLCSGIMESTEVELCKVTDCSENKDEKHEGVVFTFSEEDLGKILSEPDKFFNPIADALNSYCATNAVKCCHSVGVSSTSVTSVTYTSPNLTTYASGYPMLKTSDTQVKIIIKIDENRLRADCAKTEPLSSSIVYAQPKLVYDALSGAKTNIEEELGVPIKSVWSPEHDTTSAASATCSSLFPILLIYFLLRGF